VIGGPIALCGVCGDAAAPGAIFHPGCCAHENVARTMDFLDPARESRDFAYCTDCMSDVVLTPPEDPDDQPGWETY
jgi:hypothetical protein